MHDGIGAAFARIDAAVPMGSTFEGELFEAMVLKLKARLGASAEAMRANPIDPG